MLTILKMTFSELSILYMVKQGYGDVLYLDGIPKVTVF